MLLLHSKTLCVYKHLVIACYEKEFLKKLMHLDSQILWL